MSISTTFTTTIHLPIMCFNKLFTTPFTFQLLFPPPKKRINKQNPKFLINETYKKKTNLTLNIKVNDLEKNNKKII